MRLSFAAQSSLKKLIKTINVSRFPFRERTYRLEGPFVDLEHNLKSGTNCHPELQFTSITFIRAFRPWIFGIKLTLHSREYFNLKVGHSTFRAELTGQEHNFQFYVNLLNGKIWDFFSPENHLLARSSSSKKQEFLEGFFQRIKPIASEQTD